MKIQLIHSNDMSELESTTIVPPPSLSSSILLSSDQNRPLRLPKQKPKQLTCSSNFIDFGDCYPGQIVQTQVSINTSSWQNQILVLHLRCDCMNQELNDLPEYIFALAKNNTQNFSNEIRIKSNSENQIKFNVAMKVPQFEGLLVGIVVVRVLGETQMDPLKIVLKSVVSLPKIVCLKQLCYEDNRIIRIMIKSSRATKKEDRKIGFKNPTLRHLCLENQVIGLEESIDFVDCVPKNLNAPAGGYFNLIVQIRPSERFLDYVKRLKKNYTVRRILLLKLKSSSVIFHFPLEVVFVHSDSKEAVE